MGGPSAFGQLAAPGGLTVDVDDDRGQAALTRATRPRPTPRITAAVLAAFASTHELARTVALATERVRRPAGSRVDDVVDHARRRAVHRRWRVLEVASPPVPSMTTSPPTSIAGPAVSLTSTGQIARPSWQIAATSPPRLTTTDPPIAKFTDSATRSAANALPVAPRSSAQPAGTRIRPAGSVSTCSHRRSFERGSATGDEPDARRSSRSAPDAARTRSRSRS